MIPLHNTVADGDCAAGQFSPLAGRMDFFSAPALCRNRWNLRRLYFRPMARKHETLHQFHQIWRHWTVIGNRRPRLVFVREL
jgi:hypothetical protein